MKINVKYFNTLREAEDFVRDHLTYKAGRCKQHLISMEPAVAETFGCGPYSVFWTGRLVKAE